MIDGRLDEEVYRQVPAITEFVQQEPDYGAPITRKTEAWVLYDDKNIYIVCRCWDENPERIVGRDMRRDSPNLPQHDNFAVLLDTFHDGRNGFFLYVTAAGAMRDAQTTDERSNVDWNPVWEGRVSRDENGWISEMAIPFRSLRYGPSRKQTWGIQLRRAIHGRSEVAHLTPLNPVWGPSAINRASAAATLVGLEVPPAGRPFEIKPYAISRLTSDLVRKPSVRNQLDGNAGLDVKYGLTKGLTADFTYNTDFAQVEADEAQVNLSRFSLSFPEKREFFLEGQGTFQFGTGGSGGRGIGGEGATNNAPTLFYSRRIGLSGPHVLPVMGGGRLTGKAGPWSVGALSITTGEDVAASAQQTNFSVLRLTRDVLRRSSIGMIASRRSVGATAPGANSLWGMDTSLAFYQNVYLGGYLAQTRREGRRGQDLSYRVQSAYTTDRYGLSADRLVVEPNFNPEVGLLQRQNFRSSFVQARFSPRPASSRRIRRYSYQGSFEYITDNENHLESRALEGQARIELHNGDAVQVGHAQLYEFLPSPFRISSGVEIPVGGYRFDNTRLALTAGQQHRFSGTAAVEVGSFYGGDKKAASLRGRIEVMSQLGIEPNISLNWIDLPQGRFSTTVMGGRATFTMTTRMFVAALLQYSSSSASLSTNLRFRWEYKPGSELFVVYTEGYSTFPPRGTELENRGLVVKVNRLVRF